jgi:RNA polymerase sigma-70 factor (ECF subfamily)
LGTDTSEDELLVAVGRGELDALGEIYRRHGAAVLAVARKVVADAATAETITAEAFVELWDDPGAARLHPEGVRAHLVARVVAAAAEEPVTDS